MSPTELKVLEALVDGCGGGLYWPFDPIARHAEIERAAVRRACRSLARKGLAEFASGLWTEDGDPAGSGYRATKAGEEALHATDGKASVEEASAQAEGRSTHP